MKKWLSSITWKKEKKEIWGESLVGGDHNQSVVQKHLRRRIRTKTPGDGLKKKKKKGQKFPSKKKKEG